MLNCHKDIISFNELGLWNLGVTDCDGWLLEKNFAGETPKDTLYDLRCKRFPLPSPITTPAIVELIEENCGPHKVISDKYPNCTLCLDECTRYVDCVLFLVRNPLEVIESQIRNWRTSDLPEAEKKLRLPWARPDTDSCFSVRPNWLDYMQSWERWKRRKPCLTVLYHRFPDNATEIADFLGVDAGTMRAIFKACFRPVEWPLPSVDLPGEWVDMWRKYALHHDTDHIM
jgi:hypothetical protein